MANTKSVLINDWSDDISFRGTNTGLTANAVGHVFSGFNIKKINNNANVNLNTVLQPGIFRFESLSEINAGGTSSYPSITKPTGELSGFIQIMDNRASNATNGNEVTHIHQIIYPDASIVTASSDLESDGKFTTTAGSAPYERIGVRTSTAEMFSWTEWKVLGGSGGLQPVVLSIKTDRPTTTAVNAKENVLYIAFGNYNIVLPTASSVSTGTRIGVEQHTGTSTITESGTDRQVVAAPESTYSISYTKSTDTSVVLSKSYYTRSGSSPNYVYTLVNTPTGSPSANNYYERSVVGGNVIADAAIRYTFECELSNDGTTHIWILDVEGNHGAVIDLINERITEANNRLTRLEEVIVPVKGKKLVQITPINTLPSSTTILTNLTTTSKADIDNLYNFKLYDHIYSINLNSNKTATLPILDSEFAGGKIIINASNSSSNMYTFTLTQTINGTAYTTAFKVMPGMTTVFELEFTHAYQIGSSVYCWLLNSASPLNQ